MLPKNSATRTLAVTPQHNEFLVEAKDSATGIPYTAQVTSNFDSGNLQELLVSGYKPNHYIFYPSPDCTSTEKFARNTSWFYFRITGLPTGIKLTFEARKLNILHRIYKCGWDIYRPCIKIGDAQWKKIKERPV